MSSYIPQSLFEKSGFKRNTRQRIFTLENTFWGFLLQPLQADSSCQSVVHPLKAVARKTSGKTVSSSPSAYCQARKRLPDPLLEAVFSHTTGYGNRVHPLGKRRVVCADGTGLLAVDTPDNQHQWHQQSRQKAGCGFPQLRPCGLFNLHSGIALSYKVGNKRSHELPLLREQESTFQAGDIFVGDKGFICFYDQARLLELGVDAIVALAKRRSATAAQADKVLAHDDLLISSPKFTSTTAKQHHPKDRWASLPEAIQMQPIKIDIAVPD